MRKVNEDKLLKGIRHHLNSKEQNKCWRCPYYNASLYASCREEILKDTLAYLENQAWKGADKRPPHEGYYLVYGLTKYVPDHRDLPDGYWEIKIGYWDNKYGWLDLHKGYGQCKVKFWRELPYPPGIGMETTVNIEQEDQG